MLDDAETREVLRVAAEAAAPEKVLIAGVARESVKATVALAEAAAEYRYDAVLVRTPTYYANQMTAAAVLNYFRSVADRSPLPVVLYNIPQCAPYNIPIEIAAELAQHPNIIGIKDSSGSVERIRALVEQTRTAPRRTVTVTPVFEAVTGRMLAPRAGNGDALISVGDLAGGVAVAATPWLPSRREPKKSASRCSPVRPVRCLSRWRPAHPGPSSALPPALPRPARRSIWPGRTTTAS